MRILYMHQHFTTRRGYAGIRSYEFARYLVAQGHTVTMICSGIANEPRLSLARSQKYAQIEIDGIDCVPIAAALANPLKITRQNGYRRMWAFLHFARLASRVGKRLPRPDIVLASHTPLTIGLAGMELAQHFQIPFVFEVRDLWPQALINLGALRNPAAIWWLRRMEHRIYRAADHIIALSPGMKEGIVGTGVPEDRVTMIPNASDLDLFRPDLDRQFGRQRLGLGDRFSAIYFGAMGYANGLEYIIEAAEMLQNQGADGIMFVLHGDGKQRHRHEHQVREKGLTNVIFSDPVPDKHVVAQLVAACDVGLTVYRADKEHTWSPNKMFDALAAGKPVIVNVPGWLSQIIEENGCGRGVSPERPAELARVLLQFSRDPEGCQQMGANARSLAEREFARDRLAAKLETVLLSSIESYNKTDQVSVRGV